MTARPNPQTYPELLAAVAATLATYPTRVDQALALTAAARSPLRAANYDSPGRAGGDGAPSSTNGMRNADRDHRAIIRAIQTIRDAERALTGLVTEWAPDASRVKLFASTTENLPIWCEHCLKHGRQEPRRGNGSRLCRSCGDTERNFGKLPTAELYRLRDRGRKHLTEQEYRDALGIKTKRAG